MPFINITTLNPNNETTGSDVDDILYHEKYTSSIPLVKYALSGQHRTGVDHLELRKLEEALMKLTDIQRGLVFRIVVEDPDFSDSRIIISDGFFHSVGL